MKNRRVLIMLTVAVVAVVTLGITVLAYMYKQTEYKDNQFTPANVACEVAEAVAENEKTSIKVKNTGNIDAYLRVRFVTYWVQVTADGNTEIVSKPSAALEIPYDSDKWIKGANGTFYYKEKVAPNGGLTAELLQTGKTLALATEDGCLQVIEVFAEAIQSEPDKAVENSWGVTVDDSTNMITAVPQQ